MKNTQIAVFVLSLLVAVPAQALDSKTKFRLAPVGGIMLAKKNTAGDVGIFSGLPNITESMETKSLGMNFGGSLAYIFGGVFGLRANVTSLASGTSSGTVSGSNGVVAANVNDVKWTDLNFGPDVFVQFGNPQKLIVMIGGGVEYHKAKYNAAYDLVDPSNSDGTVKGSGSAVGGKAFIAFDWMLAQSFGLVLEGGYRFAKLNKLKADQDVFPNSNTSGKDLKKFAPTGVGNSVDFTGENLKLNLGGPYFVAGLALRF